jgi:hypothetical protein
MRRIFGLAATVVFSTTLSVTAPPAYAAGGLAWDQVTKFSTDGTIPDPNFTQDFQTASQPAEQPRQRGGMFGGIQNSINAATVAMQSFKTGIAERHYIAGSLERIDNLGQQTATITDCNARTITYLNLAKKTYRVVSMDQPEEPRSVSTAGPSRPEPVRTPDDTRMKINYTSQSLGARQLDGVATDGYKALMSVTVIKPNEAPRTMNTNLTEYVSKYEEPHQACPGRYYGMGSRSTDGSGMGSMAMNMQMTRQINAAMRTSTGDPRFTVTSSGPPLPKGRLDLFTAYQFEGQQSKGGFATIIERGNVHQITDGDKSIFGVPPDFTKET